MCYPEPPVWRTFDCSASFNLSPLRSLSAWAGKNKDDLAALHCSSLSDSCPNSLSAVTYNLSITYACSALSCKGLLNTSVKLLGRPGWTWRLSFFLWCLADVLSLIQKVSSVHETLVGKSLMFHHQGEDLPNQLANLCDANWVKPM